MAKILKRGLMISFEGIDGCGKSTQIAYAAEYLRDLGYDILVTREPGGCKISEKIRNVILDVDSVGMNPYAEALLYAASRAQHVDEILLPAIDAGKIVLSDRFVDSSAAYQGAGRGIGMETILQFNQYAIERCMPEVTFFFDFTPEAARQRMIRRGDADRMDSESREFFDRVYQGYCDLCEKYPERYRRIDVSGTKEETKEIICAELQEILKKW